ncbi:MAG: hypothetical protein AAGF79_04295 [Pseudomonadota bacterium]
MVSELILHFGMEKTGSSSIQRSFRGYDDGEIIYAPLEWNNHSMPIQVYFRPMEHQAPGMIQQGLTQAEYEARRDHAGALLDAAFKVDRKRMLMSAEGALALRRNQHLEMFQYFSDRCEKIRLIAYVRDPISYASSAFQQGLKNGRSELEVSKQRFQLRIGRMLHVYGRDRMELIPFDPKSFRKESVVFDFADRIGARITRLDESRANESMCMYAAAALFLWNREGMSSMGSQLKFQARTVLIRNLINPAPKHVQIMRKLADLANLKSDNDERGLKKFRISEQFVHDGIDPDDIAWMEKRLGVPLLRDPMPESEDYGIRSQEDFIQLGREAIVWLQPLIKRYGLKLEQNTTIDALNALYSLILERNTKKATA